MTQGSDAAARADAFALRVPCTRCGQPVATDLPNVDARQGVRARCPTCGEVQAPASAEPSSDASREARRTGEPTTLERARSVWRTEVPWVWSLGAILAVVLVAGGGAWAYERARDTMTRLTWPEERNFGPSRGVERREGRLRWRARVAGDSPAAGAECEIDATLVTDASRLQDAAVAVRCGTDVLYQGRRANGLACGVHEGPGTGFGNWEYDLGCQHRSKDAEPRFVLDTSKAHAEVRIGEPPVQVVFSLVREDGERTARPLFDASIGIFRWKPERRFRAHVDAASGKTPVVAGAQCHVRLMPMPIEELPCRAIVRCGETTLYGGFAQGFTNCVLGATGPTLATDDGPSTTDGDPILHLDLANLSALVSDTDPAWSVKLTLLPE